VLAEQNVAEYPNRSHPSRAKQRLVRSALGVIGVLAVLYAGADHPFYGGGPGYGVVEWGIGVIGVAIAACALLPLRFCEGVLLLVVSSGFALGVAELGAEALLGPRYRPIYQADDELIFKMVPGRTSEWVHSAANGGARVVHHINRSGFRGPELLPTGTATRVVVYGDSFIHAFYTAEEHTFAAKLGERLAAGLRGGVEVVNAGVSSYGPDQISVKMRSELPRLQPDLVVVAIFAGNDFGDLLRNKMFRLTDDGRLEERAWTLDPAISMRFALSQRESVLKRALREAKRSLAGADVEGPVFDIAVTLDEAELEYRSYRHDDVVTNTHVDLYSADIALTPQRESARLKIQLMGAVLERIRDVAEQHDVPLAFLFIPHPGDLPGGYDSWRIDRARFPEYDGRRQTAVLEDAALALDVPYLNLYDVFGTHDPDSLYLRGDDHWNEVGQDLAATAMADFVLNRQLLTTGSDP
jgi:hypothetical protein